jgi:hypothetical protein
LSATLAMSYNQDTMGRLTSIGWNGGASTLASYQWVGGLRQTRTVNHSATVHTDTAYGTWPVAQREWDQLLGEML